MWDESQSIKFKDQCAEIKLLTENNQFKNPCLWQGFNRSSDLNNSNLDKICRCVCVTGYEVGPAIPKHLSSPNGFQV